MPRKGKDNLIPTTMRTKEEVRENSRKGGIRSGEVRKEKALMKETLRDLLKMPLKDGDLKQIKNLAEARGKNLTVQEAILLAQIKKAITGDVKSATFVRDTVGEKPIDEINMATTDQDNPFKGLSTEELRSILFKDKTKENAKEGQEEGSS